MSKRRQSAEPSLPLFDLPLQADDPDNEAATAAQGALPLSAAPPTPAAAEPFTADAPIPAEQPALTAAEGEGHDVEYDESLDGAAGMVEEAPLLQDRLLGGLADLVVIAVAVGLMILATLLMGLRLTLTDWPPFLVFGLLLSFPYAVIPLAFWGHTPGMAWVGHTARTVVDEPLTFGQTARRWFGALLTMGLAGLPLALAWGGGRSLADRVSDSKTLHIS